MPEQIKCPSCGTKLRLPDSLLGKVVKCPKCKTSFTAALSEPDESQGISREPTPPSSRKRPPAPAEPEEKQEPEDEEEADERPRRRRSAAREEQEEEEAAQDEEDADERPRRRRRKRSRSRGRQNQEALSAVAAPAIGLMVVGSLGVLFMVLAIVFRLLGVTLVAAAAVQNQQNDPTETIRGVLFIGVDIILLLLQISIITGANKMRQLQSFSLARSAAIASMLPCSPCCLLGIPFGIWALVVIYRPEVRDSFN
jgi:predicted Zn finger-like uncharacterized protein